MIPGNKIKIVAAFSRTAHFAHIRYKQICMNPVSLVIINFEVTGVEQWQIIILRSYLATAWITHKYQ
jgi:hypothetical protein